jgi:hypothetical protein
MEVKAFGVHVIEVTPPELFGRTYIARTAGDESVTEPRRVYVSDLLSDMVGTGAPVCAPHTTIIAFPMVDDVHPWADPTVTELAPPLPIALDLS